MSDQQPTTAPAARNTKYTLITDEEIRAYQKHLRRRTNIDFSAFLRNSVKLIASDPELEARVYAMCGGGYDDDEPVRPGVDTGFWGDTQPST